MGRTLSANGSTDKREMLLYQRAKDWTPACRKGEVASAANLWHTSRKQVFNISKNRTKLIGTQANVIPNLSSTPSPMKPFSEDAGSFVRAR